MKHTKKRIPDVEKIPTTAVKAFIKTVWSIWVKFENEYLALEKSKEAIKTATRRDPDFYRFEAK